MDDDPRRGVKTVLHHADRDRKILPVARTLQVYVCPRGLHHGNLSRCGRQRRNAQGDEPRQYREKLVYETVACRKEIIFDYTIMDANQ